MCFDHHVSKQQREYDQVKKKKKKYKALIVYLTRSYAEYIVSTPSTLLRLAVYVTHMPEMLFR
jgi:hypothetical protein